ncbi:YceH family protein [Chitinilyticum piscinae]|uniref:YceH family protein n=1 Tax=Chitinilyticum piscinae TaxID=2866724 RepID=A0A8J7FJ18_9NEIS|nr:YceH family protein [Chitinilyticum piscinae]MBE9608732.1 YceH family protein [Chitinilyticum piscinae]
MTDTAIPVLGLNETRVLGVLIEKQHTVPDSYPLTLNSLVTGCNQKSSRDPVLELGEAEVLAALEILREHALVGEVFGNRAMRYEHFTGKSLQIPAQAVALLATLMLRGPQTAGELRTNCERLHRFSDISAVEGFLEELAERHRMVLKLPRQPGAREARWAHLLSGEVNVEALASAPQAASGGIAELREEVAALRAEVAELRALVAALTA